MPTSGLELRRKRLLAEITVTALAAQMGTSRTSLWVLERSAKVSAEHAARYREAVKTLRAAIDGEATA
jgi:predicted transcriptional regulator